MESVEKQENQIESENEFETIMRHFKFNCMMVIGMLVAFTGCSSEEQSSGEQGMSQTSADEAAIAEIIESASFTDLDGNEVSVEDYQGKVLLIDFWETWCGPCLQVFPAMQDLREEFPDRFDVLAVTLGLSEGPDEAKAFREEHGYDFHFLYDEFEVSNELGIYSIPYKIYISPDGRLIKQEIGSSGREGDYNRAREVILEYSN